MIRQNLLLIGLILLASSGCSALTMHEFSAGKGAKSCSKCNTCRQKPEAKHAATCSCKSGKSRKTNRLFPGDTYGQCSASCGSCEQSWGPHPGYENVGAFADMASGYGCSSCSTQGGGGSCGSDPYACSAGGGCSSCDSNSFPMSMPMAGMQTCNCGGQHSFGPPQQFVPQQLMTPPNSSGSGLPGTAAPLAPAEVFRAPVPPPSDGALPPVPTDGAPPATPAVDPVSWEVPTLPPLSNHNSYPGQKVVTQTVHQIPTTRTR